MGMSYLTSLNTQLFKNIAYVGSFGHILFNFIFNVNSNLAESSANCSGERESSTAFAPELLLQFEVQLSSESRETEESQDLQFFSIWVFSPLTWNGNRT